ALPPDLERVAEALGRDEPGPRALSLDECVGKERRGMYQSDAVARRDRALTQQTIDPRHDAARGVVVRGQLLVARPLAGHRVVDDDVGEGPADVDPQPAPLRHHRPLGLPDLACIAICKLAGPGRFTGT